MPIVNLAKGSLITVNGITLSDHNRAAAHFDFDKFGVGDRTLTAKMVFQAIANKRKLAISWSLLPGLDGQTVDGKAGRNTIFGLVQTAWTTYTSPYIVTWKEANASNVEVATTIRMFVDSYNEELVKRVNKQQWNIQLSLVEE